MQRIVDSGLQPNSDTYDLDFSILLHWPSPAVATEGNLSRANAPHHPLAYANKRTRLFFEKACREDIQRWKWVVSAPDFDGRLERFLENGRDEPLTLLLYILKRDRPRSPRSVASLIEFIAQSYIPTKTSLRSSRLADIPRTIPDAQAFARLLDLLTSVILEVWPSAIVSVARLLSDYLKRLEYQASSEDILFKVRCRLFNFGLRLFSKESPRSPVLQMTHNWQAQRHLLEMSTNMEPPLLIGKESYLAIRKVMVALPKTSPERKVAQQLVSAWPPYRQDWDGTDEMRTIEDDLSRNVKAGSMARVAGYSDRMQDRQLDILGGAELGISPTVQTRSRAPKVWEGRRVSLNVFTEWACRVRATRNAQEAWQMFNTPPATASTIRPNFQVYAELFEKLYAEDVNTSQRHVLPGDARQTFPPHNAHFSEVEIARRQPPSPLELYEQLLRDGNRPVGKCVTVLIENAPDIDAAFRYLQDTGINKRVIEALRAVAAGRQSTLPARTLASPDFITAALSYHRQGVFNGQPIQAMQTANQESALKELLAEIPLHIFSSYVKLLTRLHTPRFGQLQLLDQSIVLSESRFTPKDAAHQLYHTVWDGILRKLASPDHQATRGINLGAKDPFKIFMKIFSKLKREVGLTPRLFERLCGILLVIREAGDKTALSHELLAISSWRELTKPILNREDGETTYLPTLREEIIPSTIYNYMRLLIAFKNHEEMVRLADWLIDAWKDGTIMERAKDPGHHYHELMEGNMSMFRGFAKKHVSAGERQRIAQKMSEAKENEGFSWGPAEEPLEIGTTGPSAFEDTAR
jgi:DNA (cytosine-5)-methyltransferase 1